MSSASSLTSEEGICVIGAMARALCSHPPSPFGYGEEQAPCRGVVFPRDKLRSRIDVRGARCSCLFRPLPRCPRVLSRLIGRGPPTGDRRLSKWWKTLDGPAIRYEHK